jgi:hypothetical protein
VVEVARPAPALATMELDDTYLYLWDGDAIWRTPK